MEDSCKATRNDTLGKKKLTTSSLVLELPDGNVNGEAEGSIVLLEAIRCKLGQ